MKRTLTIIAIAALAVALIGSLALAKSKRTAWLGVATAKIDRELAKDLNLESRDGAVIVNVVEDSPAEEAGLREDDIIISFNGEPIERPSDLTRAVRDAKPRSEATLVVLRDGKKLDFKVELDSRSANSWTFRDGYAPAVPALPSLPALPSVPSAPQAYYFSDDGDDFTIEWHGSGAYLGVGLQELSDQLGEYFGVEGDRGVLVTEVFEDSPAEKAGVKAGDVVIGIDKDKVYEVDDLQEALTDLDEGTTVQLHILREKKPIDIAVEVEESSARSYRLGHFRNGMPDVDGLQWVLPKMKGLHKGMYEVQVDHDEVNEEMEELREELQELKEHLRELKKEVEKQ